MRIMSWIFKRTLLNEPFSIYFDKLSVYVLHIFQYLCNLSAQQSELYFPYKVQLTLPNYPTNFSKLKSFSYLIQPWSHKLHLKWFPRIHTCTNIKQHSKTMSATLFKLFAFSQMYWC